MLKHLSKFKSRNAPTEMVFAVGMLVVVLAITTTVASRALAMGADSRDRTILINAAQDQLESVRSFRDSHSWNEFLYGDTLGGSYSGVLIGAASALGGPLDGMTRPDGAKCIKVAPCFNMGSGAGGILAPKAFAASGPLPGSYLEVAVIPNAAIKPMDVEVLVSYGTKTSSGALANVGVLRTKLSSLTPGGK